MTIPTHLPGGARRWIRLPALALAAWLPGCAIAFAATADTGPHPEVLDTLVPALMAKHKVPGVSIAGEPFEPYLTRTLRAPLGITTGGFSWQDRFAAIAAAGHDARGEVPPARELFREANTAYSFYCSPAEYARFILEMLRVDRSAPHSLSALSIATMLTPVSETTGPEPLIRHDGSRPTSSHYGLGWALDLTPHGKRVRHSGSNGTGFRCYCEFHPERGTGIVIMTNAAGGAALWRDVIARVGEP